MLHRVRKGPVPPITVRSIVPMFCPQAASLMVVEISRGCGSTQFDAGLRDAVVRVGDLQAIRAGAKC